MDAFPLLYPAAKAVFFPLNTIFLDAKNNGARTYGFTNTQDACYDGAVPGIAAPANAPLCTNPDQYIYWARAPTLPRVCDAHPTLCGLPWRVCMFWPDVLFPSMTSRRVVSSRAAASKDNTRSLWLRRTRSTRRTASWSCWCRTCCRPC